MDDPLATTFTVIGILIEIGGLSLTVMSLTRWWRNANGPKYQWLREELKPVPPPGPPQFRDSELGYVVATIEDPLPARTVSELESRVSEGNTRLRQDFRREDELIRASLADVLDRMARDDRERDKQTRLDVRQAAIGVALIGVGAVFQLVGSLA